jgi:hypothetical protein
MIMESNKLDESLFDKFNFKKFIENVKQGGKDSKLSYLLIKNYIVNGQKLDDEQKKFVTKNLLNVLKGVATATIPGGITFMVLVKLIKPYFKNIKIMKEDKIKGGKADNKSVKDIAKKFGVTVAKINKELKMGIEVEYEHTNSKNMAKEIAMDHLMEIPDYYTRLKKMEKEGESKWKKREKKIDESIKDYISDLLRINLK